MNIATYFRVSTKGQGDAEKYGLPRQQDDVQAFLSTRSDVASVTAYEDVGYSGATADRPGLAKLLMDAKAGLFEAVVVASLDRLARDVTLMGYIKHVLRGYNVKVYSATQSNDEDPTSKLVQDILAAVAGYERHLIAARLAGSRRAKAARGGYAHGQPPYGWKAVAGHLEPSPLEQEILARIQDERKSGLSYERIAALRNQSQDPSRSGSLWYASSVQSVLRTALKY
jgi:DNA invertase Pin-like site-specific DNA recombinase